MLLVLSTSCLGEIIPNQTISNPKDVLRCFMPAKLLTHPLLQFAVQGSRVAVVEL